jgi:tetratricopeptide (TPR) repeat protein
VSVRRSDEAARNACRVWSAAFRVQGSAFSAITLAPGSRGTRRFLVGNANPDARYPSFIRTPAAVRLATFLIAALAAVAGVHAQPATAPAPAQTESATGIPVRTPGKWLVDLGRDYPLTPQASLTDADAELTLAFMQAAARIEPTLAEAYFWQPDLLRALHRENEATDALGQYVRLEPDDWSAHILWIAAKTDTFQTIEERVRFWEERLKQPNLPGEVASDLHRRIAAYYYNRRDTANAKTEITQALRLFPQSLLAQKLQLAMAFEPRTSTLTSGATTRAGEGREERASIPDDPAGQLRFALDIVRVSPAQWTSAWDVAKLLDSLSMEREAQPWYQHALAMFQRANPGQNVPGELLLEMAASQIDAGMFEAADKLIEDVIKTGRDGAIPRLLLARSAKRRSTLYGTTRATSAPNLPQETKRFTNWADVTQKQLALAREAYEADWRRVKARPDHDLAAEMAWFYCVDDPNVDRAYELAQVAMHALSPSPLARRAFGYAAAQKGQLAEAQKVLDPIAETDPWAAVALATVKEKSGDNKAAIELLTHVAERNRSGQVFQEVASRLAKLGAPIPPPPTNANVRQVLASFDQTMLLFPTDPGKFVELTVTPLVPASGVLLPGEPLWCRLILKNTGTFGIAIGKDLMVNPIVPLLAKSTGDRERNFEDLVRIMVDRRQWLSPGESIVITQTIDIGPLRSALIGTPQVTQTIDIAPLLNATYVPEQQTWSPGFLRPFAANPAHIVRKGASPDDPGPTGLQETLKAARTGTVPRRAEALDRLMMWLAEQEHLRAGRLNYDARPVDTEALRAAVQERFNDPAWEVRAHLAEALRWVTLDKDFARLASGMLSDSNGLVRMLTVRLFADHQKAQFDKVAAYFAQSDPDPLVRAVATAVRQRWAAATRPATTQPATTAPAAH